jgi:sialate O-acetylesterase
MMNMHSSIMLLLSMAATVSAADQPLELAAPFTDNMILQRESDVPVWGVDAPGNQVTVEFAGQTRRT